jgi:GDP-mannose 6-dehydrogenase
VTKLVVNTWHATKVGFASEIGRVCEHLGISARQVHEVFVSDTKLNLLAYYTRPGRPLGGSCLPKDLRALQRIAADFGANTHLIDSLLRSNDAHKHHQYRRVTDGLKPGARVLIVGLAFKLGTDDLREGPAVDLARMLLDDGYLVEICAPLLEPENLIGQNLGYAVAQLPSLDSLLVDKPTAEGGP